jgi:hypothetical protein
MEKFKVGDKVKIVRMDTKWSAYQKVLNKYIGTIGKIVKTEGLVSDDDPYHDVEFLDGLTFSIKDEWLELVEKKKTGWNGKVVCVNIKPMVISCRRFFSVGKVYKVVNGKLLDDDNNINNPWTGVLDPIKDFNDLIERTKNYYDFIEFKGFAGK